MFVDIGALWGIRSPATTTVLPESEQTRNQCIGADGNIIFLPTGTLQCPEGAVFYRTGLQPFGEEFVGNSMRPRLSIGIGVNWNSPFGPFRVDIAHALLSERGDEHQASSAST